MVKLHGQVTRAPQEHSRAQKVSGKGKQESLMQETASLQGRDTAEQDSATSMGHRHKRTMGRAGVKVPEMQQQWGKGAQGFIIYPFRSCLRNL